MFKSDDEYIANVDDEKYNEILIFCPASQEKREKYIDDFFKNLRDNDYCDILFCDEFWVPAKVHDCGNSRTLFKIPANNNDNYQMYIIFI